MGLSAIFLSHHLLFLPLRAVSIGLGFHQLELKLRHLDVEIGLPGKHLSPACLFFKPLEIVLEIIASERMLDP